MAKKKTKPKRAFRRAPRTPIRKETVRVKTFIMEKPVFVPYRERRAQRRAEEEALSEEDYGEEPKSRRGAKKPVEEDYDAPAYDDSNPEMSDEAQASAEGYEDLGKEGEEFVDDVNAMTGPGLTESGHVRSMGLFYNTWWKKGLLKGFAVWLAVLVFSYFMDFVNLVDVEGAKNWFILLLALLVLGVIYEKVFAGKAKF